jgi:hypothetical protein
VLTFDEMLRRRVSWTVLAIACIAYVCLGLAESGVRRTDMDVPPDAPLPFRRDHVFGVDLRAYSSLQAREWLAAAGSPSLPLIVLPIDGDVVTALGHPDGQPAAFAAIDSLIQAATGSPLGVCLHKPAGTVGGLGVAQAAVGVLTERYPTSIVYVSACEYDTDPQWQQDVANATLTSASTTIPPTPALIPLSTGEAVYLSDLSGPDQLRRGSLVSRGTDAYTVYVVPFDAPAESTTVEHAVSALRTTAHAALFLARPRADVDPAALLASIGGARIDGPTLPDGFTTSAAPQVTVGEGWQLTSVATVPYRYSPAESAAMAVEIIGTDVHMLALEAPQAGVVNIWIDPDAADQTHAPDAVIDLAADQARDAAVEIASGLPASRHRLVLQAVNADGSTVAISGFFVTGKPTPVWTGLLAAVALYVIAGLAIAERCYSSLVSIRGRAQPLRRRPVRSHPRVFARER